VAPASWVALAKSSFDGALATTGIEASSPKTIAKVMAVAATRRGRERAFPTGPVIARSMPLTISWVNGCCACWRGYSPQHG
jgi:hypothetical protein